MVITKQNKKAENKFFQEKKAVSEMISYVILITIAIGLAIGIFSWLKDYPNSITPKIDCKEGTSIRLENYSCADGTFTINIKNNGMFDVNGFFMMVGNNSQRQPIKTLYFIPNNGNLPGYYTGRINVSETKTISFLKEDLTQIQIVQIQPFILDAKNKKILCEQGVIKQDLEECVFSST